MKTLYIHAYLSNRITQIQIFFLQILMQPSGLRLILVKQLCHMASLIIQEYNDILELYEYVYKKRKSINSQSIFKLARLPISQGKQWEYIEMKSLMQPQETQNPMMLANKE
ncbi:hypothetical protein pb186bvf_020737 [Paramecium bursaria]